MKMKSGATLYIKYGWDKSERDGVDLDVLAESINGFNSVIQEFAKIGKFKGGISIKAKRADGGSIILETFITAASSLPFESITDYNNFLTTIGEQVVTTGLDIFNEAHRDINDFFGKNPLDLALLGWFVVRMIKWAKLQKKSPVTQNEEGMFLPKNFAIQLHRMINRKIYKKALRPFTEDQVNKINIYPKDKEDDAATIDTGNFENYLSEDEQILPEYENGRIYRFVGRVVGLESSRGEYMKFKAAEVKREYSLLVAYPEINKTTEHYVDYYKKPVIISAEVIRGSLYQKPKLAIKDIKLMQESLI
ncbi:MAG: hypothetical protein Q8Q06_00165 [bacterium]|nr:hypothetical protein [bacterium]